MRLHLIALPAAALLLGIGAAHAQPAPSGPPPGYSGAPDSAAPAPAPMQAPMPAPMPPGGRQRGVTRDQFVQRATDAAARHFDAMDTNHDGILEPSERRAWVAARRAGANGGAGPITVHSGQPATQ